MSNSISLALPAAPGLRTPAAPGLRTPSTLAPSTPAPSTLAPSTLILSTLALLLYFSPGASSWLSLDRAAVESGQLWRLLTGHWVHWSAEHLGWSLLVFFAVGTFWEKTGRRGSFLVCTVGSALLISLAVWFWQPGLESYRGLSGIDCALVTGAACDALRRAWRQGRRALAGALVLTLVGYALKVGYEMAVGGTVFVDAASASFSAAPLAHLVGGGFGCLVGLARIVSPMLSYVYLESCRRPRRNA